MEEIFFLIITLLCAYSLISTFICLYWATGTLVATSTTSFYDRKMWRTDHKTLTNIIGVGGFLGVWFIISTGIYHLMKVITLPLVDAFPLLGEYRIKGHIAMVLFIICFFVTFILWARLVELIELKENKGREEHIQYRLQDLRRDYLYNPYEWIKEEYEADDDEDTSVDMETHIAFIKGEPIDKTEKKKIERSHAIMEEIDKRNEAEWEEIKRAAADKVKIQIDELRKKTKWTGKATKSRNQIRMQDELEALYRFLDEISEKFSF